MTGWNAGSHQAHSNLMADLGKEPITSQRSFIQSYCLQHPSDFYFTVMKLLTAR